MAADVYAGTISLVASDDVIEAIMPNGLKSWAPVAAVAGGVTWP